jgi:hypothetical protein
VTSSSVNEGGRDLGSERDPPRAACGRYPLLLTIHTSYCSSSSCCVHSSETCPTPPLRSGSPMPFLHFLAHPCPQFLSHTKTWAWSTEDSTTPRRTLKGPGIRYLHGNFRLSVCLKIRHVPWNPIVIYSFRSSSLFKVDV